MTNNGNVLLEGTIVELRAPDLENEILKGDWHSWFNDSKITRFLEHGLYPNTREKQYKFITNELTNDSNLILSIYEKKTNRHIGVISLKNIDFINSNAEIAIVMGVSNIAGSAIEAMALLTEHGFNRLNLQKLYAGQHESLWKWVNVLRTIGFKVEGIKSNQCCSFNERYDVILTGVSKNDYYKLLDERGGSIFCNDIIKHLKSRSKINFMDDLRKVLDTINISI